MEDSPLRFYFLQRRQRKRVEQRFGPQRRYQRYSTNFCSRYLKRLGRLFKNPVFNKALDEADVLQQSTDDPYVESFFVAFENIKGSTNLADPDIFANRTLSEQINFEMSDEEVRPIIRRKIDESIISAFEVLRKRIDKFGVTQPNIQRLGTSGRILVELPGAKDVERVKNLLQSTAQLEFWETFNGEVLRFLKPSQ